MKKIRQVALLVALLGVFVISCNSNKSCKSNCCKTEACKKNCIDSGCCEKNKTCDITAHKECKHKCCSVEKEQCTTKGEKSCCKTKKQAS